MFFFLTRVLKSRDDRRECVISFAALIGRYAQSLKLKRRENKPFGSPCSGVRLKNSIVSFFPSLFYGRVSDMNGRCFGPV